MINEMGETDDGVLAEADIKSLDQDSNPPPQQQDRTLPDTEAVDVDSDDDRKPAAKQLDGDAERDHEDSDQEDDESSSGSDEESESENESSNAVVTEEGRSLSQYEIQRLERIKRNRQYLKQLGLDGESSFVVDKPKQRKGRRTKAEILASSHEEVSRRETISRRSKLKKVSYAEPRTSVRDLFRQADQKDTDLGANADSGDVATSLIRNEKKNVTDRMDQTIFIEFKRIKAHKRLVEKTATRHFRAAQKEVKFWNKLIPIWERQAGQRLESEQRIQMGGKSAKELLAFVDKRMPAIVRGIKRYDEWVLAMEREHAFEQRRMASDYKVKLMSALDRFPKGIKQAASLLDAVLLECAPIETSMLRRTTRSVVESQLAAPPPVTPKKMKRKPPALPSGEIKTKIPDCVHESLADVEAKSKPVQVKQRKRVARNVGGWISPDFSEKIDRSWLQEDRPPKRFDLTTYVPQAGDIVMYYMAGHRGFLSEYPDELGKKTRSKLRIPLWERAAQLHSGRENSAETGGQTEGPCWWTSEWLESTDSPDFGCYPLICRVERAHAEFPPDPCGKVVQRDSDGTTLHFKKPKKAAVQKGAFEAQIRLAVTLRPLVPLLFPEPNNAESGHCSQLSVPPSFTAMTFPCESDPFIVPLAWGYLRSHCLYPNQDVSVSSLNNESARVKSFAPLGVRLDDIIDDVKRTLAHFDGVSAKNAALEKELAQDRLDMPVKDARVVLDTWYRVIKPTGTTQDSVSMKSSGFVELLKMTLPVWKGVTVALRNGEEQSSSPWNLVQGRSSVDTKSPWRIGEHNLQLEEAIRAKVQKRLDDFDIQDWVLFDQTVTEDEAPLYYCAVPVGMAYSVICERVSLNKGVDGCYYRSLDAIMSDISSILDCCLLYNSPESEVVAVASEFVTLLKYEIAQAVRGSDMYATAAMNVEREKILSGFLSQSSIMDSLKRPFKHGVHRHWLDQYQREEQPSKESTSTPIIAVPFQAGDSVLYSRCRHTHFVEKHFSSLDSDQSFVPSPGMVFGLASSGDVETSEASPQSVDDWVRGEIVWVRSAFPMVPSKSSDGDFRSLAVIQRISIKFHGIDELCVVYWRPCLFSFDTKHADEACDGCGLSQLNSFLRLQSSLSRIAHGDDVGHCEENNLTSSTWLETVDRCLNVLKKRCTSRLHPTYLDPGLTKQNVQDGYIQPLMKNAKTVPTYTRLFDMNPSNEEAAQKIRDTRGKSWKPKQEDSDVARLVKAGFLPPWVTGSTGDESENTLFETFASRWPSPKLSLELVQLRVRFGYYRDRSAILNDIVEAYLSTVCSTVADVVARKKSPIPIGLIARSLADSAPGNVDSVTTDIVPEKLAAEVERWVRRLHSIRALYATALVCLYETHFTELLYGLVSYEPPKIARQEDPVRVQARQTLVDLLGAFRKGDGKPTFSGDFVRSKKLVIKLGGESTSELQRYRSQTKRRLLAATDEKVVNLRLKPSSLIPSSNQDLAMKESALFPPITFDIMDYVQSDSLTRIMFGQPGRSSPCARCQVFLRAALHCRVVDKHENREFDWGSEFATVTAINDLLNLLDPIRSTDDVDHGDSSMVAVTKESDDGRGETEGEGKGKVDPSEFARKAHEVLQLSNEVLKEASLFLEKPARLSREFVKAAFPIDPSDGHFIYCVVCGLSGDLLCCDGCPNVVHSDCVHLSSLPEGDWFCEECEKKPANVGQETTTADLQQRSTCFERNEFDAGKSDRIASLLDELRQARPRQKLKSVSNVENPVENDDASTTTVDGTVSNLDAVTEHDNPPKRLNETLQNGKLPRVDRKNEASKASAVELHDGERIAVAVEVHDGDRDTGCGDGDGTTEYETNENAGSEKARIRKGRTRGGQPSNLEGTRKRQQRTDDRVVDQPSKLEGSRKRQQRTPDADNDRLAPTAVVNITRKHRRSTARKSVANAEISAVSSASKPEVSQTGRKRKASALSKDAFMSEILTVGSFDTKPSVRSSSRSRGPPVRFVEAFNAKRERINAS